jgi:hypothetical protein
MSRPSAVGRTLHLAPASWRVRAFWTQGGDSFPGNDAPRDTVVGIDNPEHDRSGEVWRWRSAFQHGFAARLDWTLKSPAEANHNPLVVVNSRPGTEPLEIKRLVRPDLRCVRQH